MQIQHTTTTKMPFWDNDDGVAIFLMKKVNSNSIIIEMSCNEVIRFFEETWNLSFNKYHTEAIEDFVKWCEKEYERDYEDKISLKKWLKSHYKEYKWLNKVAEAFNLKQIGFREQMRDECAGCSAICEECENLVICEDPSKIYYNDIYGKDD